MLPPPDSAAVATVAKPLMERIRHHVQLLFLINGLLLASWAVEIPTVQEKLGLGDGPMGLLLFTMVVGNVAALPVANAALPRVGIRVTATFGLLLMALSLTALPFSGSRGCCWASSGPGLAVWASPWTRRACGWNSGWNAS